MEPSSPTYMTPAINVIAWFLLVVSILSVVTRLGTKIFVVRKLAVDDYVICISLVFCISQSISVSVETANHYGQNMDTLSNSQLNAAMKSRYSAEILFIASLFFSKLSIIAFVQALSPSVSDRKFAFALGIFTAIWALTSEFVTAFQCNLPRPWDSVHNRCFNMTVWWNFFGAINILTEIALIVQPIFVIIPIQMNLKKKAMIVACFATRSFVIVAIIFQLIYSNRAADSKDPTFDSSVVTICIQFVQCLSIATSCVPHFKPFLKSLRSSGMRLYELPGESAYRSDTSWKLSSRSRKNTLRSRDNGRFAELIQGPENGRNQTTATAGEGPPERDSESQSSQSRIIRETRTWTIAQGPRHTLTAGYAADSNVIGR